MLPSSFATKTDSNFLQRRLEATQALTQFFQELVAERTRQILKKSNNSESTSDKAKLLQTFHEHLLRQVDKTPTAESQLTQPFLSLQDTLQFARLFKEEFQLENLSLTTLQVMCRMLGLQPFRFRGGVILQLRHHILKLQKEDKALLWEGLDNLSHEDLIEACKNRAMRFHNITPAELRSQLKTWLEFSSHKEITPTLLLWTRSVTLTHNQSDIDQQELIPDVVELQCEGPDAADQSQNDKVAKTQRLEALADILRISGDHRDNETQDLLEPFVDSDEPAEKPSQDLETDLLTRLSTTQKELASVKQALNEQHLISSRLIQEVLRYVNESDSPLTMDMKKILEDTQAKLESLSQQPHSVE